MKLLCNGYGSAAHSRNETRQPRLVADLRVTGEIEPALFPEQDRVTGSDRRVRDKDMDFGAVDGPAEVMALAAY